MLAAVPWVVEGDRLCRTTSAASHAIEDRRESSRRYFVVLFGRAKHPLEDRIDVLEVKSEVEVFFDLGIG